MFDNVTFDAEAFANNQRLAGNAWRNAEGKADDFARSATAALVTTSLTPLALAISVYDEMQPKTAKGALAEPKESPNSVGGVSVSSLRSAKGGEGARSTLEALFYVYDNRDLDADAVADFILGKRGAFRLFPLKKHIQRLKADAAKAEKEAAVPASSEEREGDEQPETVNDIAVMAERIASMEGEELIANADAIALLLEACRDAADKLAAAEQLTGTNG